MYSYILIMVMSLVTIAIRFLPFILFRKETPDFVLYLGKTLPPCAMAMLVVYCFRNSSLLSIGSFLPELLSAVLVVVLYKWKHSTALAIVAGTILYMFLVQNIFS